MNRLALSVPLAFLVAACGNGSPPEPTANPEPPKTAAAPPPPPAPAPTPTPAPAASAAPAPEPSAAPSAEAAASAEPDKAEPEKGEHAKHHHGEKGEKAEHEKGEHAKAAKEGEGEKGGKGPFPESTNADLKDPKKQKGEAPAVFLVKFDTSAGAFEVECKREWAPHGVDRFYHLVKIGFFDDVAFFRVVKEPRPFVVQFGIHGNPDVAKVWSDANLPPDAVKGSNKRGFLTYAMAGRPDTRATQLFFNLGDNANLDKMGFGPICEVKGEGMKVVDALEGSYGEAPSGQQGRIQSEGNKFLRTRFPKLDYIKTVRVVKK